MKRIKSIISLLPLLMIGMLTASCGSAEQEEAGGDKDYTVTNEEYVSKRSEFSNPKMILNTNVSWNYTFSNSSSQSTIKHLSKNSPCRFRMVPSMVFSGWTMKLAACWSGPPQALSGRIRAGSWRTRRMSTRRTARAIASLVLWARNLPIMIN